MGTKVLLLGLDGADRSLVDAWTRDGTLPTLAALRERGHWGELAGQPGLGDDAAWASFSTTLRPEHHGRFHHQRPEPDGVSLVAHRRDDMTVPPFWDALVGAGRRVAVVDVPKSPMGDDCALVISDWMVHGAEGPMRLSRTAAAHPAAAVLQTGPEPDFDCNRLGPTADDVAAFEAACVRRNGHRTAVLRGLLEGDDWDLFVATFGTPHCAGHRTWRDHDVHHPEHDPGRRAQVGDVVEHVYADVDRCVRTLVDAAGDDALVVVFSVLGMGPNHHGSHLAEEVLRRGTGATAPNPARLADGALSRVPGWLRRRVPWVLSGLGQRARIRHERAKPYRVVPADLTSTPLRIAAARSTDADGVRHVPPMARQELTGTLGALVDPASRRPLVEAVVFTQDVYPGARTFADAFVLWDPTARIDAVRAEGLGALHRPAPPLRSGNHRPGGWFVAAGPGVEHAGDSLTGEIVDLGVTVAARLGVELDVTDGHRLALGAHPEGEGRPGSRGEVGR